MKILADIALSNAQKVFAQYGEVVVKKGREIVADDLVDVDVLITRSITKVNKDLLTKANKLKFVGTATAGTDHIDIDYLNEKGIKFTNAAGSNKESVGDYVLSVLLVFANRYDLNLEGMTIGIVGCGNTGTQVEHKAKALGMTVLKCDPPRLAAGDKTCFATLDECLACDFISFHVPLIKDGPYCTVHMLTEEKLRSLKPNMFVINASRGVVVDNEALVKVLNDRHDLKVWLDVFEGEPEIKVKEVLPLVKGATPHIAGYSYESKRRAVVMLAEDMAKMLNLPKTLPYQMPASEFSELYLGAVSELDRDVISRLVFSIYDVRRDSLLFKNRFTDGKSFDLMRQTYRDRRELSSLKLLNVPSKFKERLSLLGFNVQD